MSLERNRFKIRQSNYQSYTKRTVYPTSIDRTIPTADQLAKQSTPDLQQMPDPVDASLTIPPIELPNSKPIRSDQQFKWQKPPTPTQPIKSYLTTSNDTVVPNVPDASIAINISLPKLPKPKLPKLPKLPYKQISILASIVLVAGLLSWGAYSKFGHDLAKKQKTTTSVTDVGLASSNSFKPSFSPVFPANKSNVNQLGQTAVYDKTKNTVSFQDTLDGTQITVSQQPVPSEFHSVQDAVTSISKSFTNKTTLNTSNGVAYLSTDSKSSSQFIVGGVNGLLILIQSPFSHSSNEWVSYLNNLK